MKIVPMTTEDAKALAELDILCFAVPWSEKSFFEEANNHLARYFVAKDDDKIIGYGGIWLVSGEGNITNIAVHPEYRKSAELRLRLVASHLKNLAKQQIMNREKVNQIYEYC